MARPKVVWILGSGFSKHVGGPLLNELLTPRSMRELETLFPHPALPTLHAVYEIFRSHVKGISNSPYWEHAEEFLSFVDSAADPQSRRHKVTEDLCSQHKTQQFNGSPQELRRRAAIAIAAECIAFLSTIDLDTESWQPYLQWGEAVSDPDAIITFNYDRVLEEMAEHPQRICNFSQNTVQIPNRLNVAAGSVPIYKLHGSVDWFLLRDPNGNQFTWLEPDLPKQLGLGFEPLIATPGNTKKNYCDEYLSDLWKASRDHLREADVVVFMGYRFPPSDSQAVTSVLGALKDNDKSLRVHVVL
ncbi:MAG TPA: SIR2 family protein, partial [Terriglobales bacterium]|nr:SIR2 family protein [Terriglobales bacterium]